MPDANKQEGQLPAYTCLGNEVDLWPEAPGLSYSQGNDEGRARAEQLVDVIRRTGQPSLLGHVVEAIAKGGTFGGVEIGFFHAISLEIITPVAIREFVEVPDRRGIPVARQLGHLRIVA